ncbi:hypothetical protein THMIRHAS_03820 [Thiosulfatimonas sediminis]|uniref:HTH cro/C1-type domain-containing protein n=1 Tax=Thiosulfatimonas sediminis TaxID=2675054 RepID=A0A6F8PSC9_9GAMM|nr:helix-turn-helix domain-containing protein [Thiosulfatimonas sediminis]BBP45009.1 hypothetical protein THMIRHAS_03820 [Thiosulfatimonas sediminis]
MYHYTDSGLDNIYLENGYQLENMDDEEYLSIHHMDELHAAIGGLLVEKSAPLTANEFRYLRTELNLSQKALGGVLGVDSQTVARWEKAETQIPRTSDVVLRAYFLESQNQTSSIAYLLKMLSESEAMQEAEQITLEEINDHWQAKRTA